MGEDDDDGVLLLPSAVAPPQRVVPLLFVGGARGILLYLVVKDDNLFGCSNDPTFREEEFLFPLLLPLLHVVPCSEPPYIGLAALHLADLGDIITNLLLC